MTPCYQDEMSSDPIEANLKHVEERIRNACARAGRNPADIRVLLATKTVAPDRLMIAVQNRYTLFGENTAQELVKKYGEFPNSSIEWHFIGRLQTNKVKDVLPRCHCIHSLDRFSLAQEIQKRATKPVRVLIEIHSSDEDTKAGISLEQLPTFLHSIANMDKLIVSGAMTIADNVTEPEQIRKAFRKTKDALEIIKNWSPTPEQVTVLSMGMSSDYEIAIEEGANLIRLGSAVFGQRN